MVRLFAGRSETHVFLIDEYTIVATPDVDDLYECIIRWGEEIIAVFCISRPFDFNHAYAVAGAMIKIYEGGSWEAMNTNERMQRLEARVVTLSEELVHQKSKLDTLVQMVITLHREGVAKQYAAMVATSDKAVITKRYMCSDGHWTQRNVAAPDERMQFATEMSAAATFVHSEQSFCMSADEYAHEKIGELIDAR